VWVPVGLVALALLAWYVGHPRELPVADDELSATVRTGQTVYVGVLGPAHEGDRNLSVRGVELETTGGTEDIELDAWICVGGSIGQTTDPTRFCDEVDPAEGHTLHLGGGDQLMVSASAEEPQTVRSARARISYREGVQFATQQAGAPIAVEVHG
jgi:hypothetical protein